MIQISCDSSPVFRSRLLPSDQVDVGLRVGHGRGVEPSPVLRLLSQVSSGLSMVRTVRHLRELRHKTSGIFKTTRDLEVILKVNFAPSQGSRTHNLQVNVWDLIREMSKLGTCPDNLKDVYLREHWTYPRMTCMDSLMNLSNIHTSQKE